MMRFRNGTGTVLMVVAAGLIWFGCGDDNGTGPVDRCAGIDSLALMSPVEGAVLTAGQPVEIAWCYGPAGGVNIRFEDDDGTMHQLNASAQILPPQQTFTFTPTEAMRGIGYLIVSNYNDDAMRSEVSVTVE